MSIEMPIRHCLIMDGLLVREASPLDGAKGDGTRRDAFSGQRLKKGFELSSHRV